MSGFAFFVAGVLPYLTVALFLIAMGYRFYGWLKTPQPGKMTLFPTRNGSTVKAVLADVFFFPGLFKGDRVLWFMSWFFHVTLVLVFLGHLRVVTGFIDSMLLSFGMSAAGVQTLSSTAGGGAGILMLATGVLLLIRRATTERVRELSSFSDYFALLLLLAIIVTGDLMRFGTHMDLGNTRAWVAALVTFQPAAAVAHVSGSAATGMFLAHALLGQLLILSIPFSKILHFGGIFFTQALVHRR